MTKEGKDEMEKEFDLSKLKEVFVDHHNKKSDFYWGDDIKEFIDREYELLKLYRRGKINFADFLRRRKQLAGDKLI